MRSLAFLSPFTDHNDYPFITLHFVNSAPFHMPHSWKRYPFKAEPPYVGHCRKYPPPGGGRRKTTSKKFHFSDNTLTSTDFVSTCVHNPVKWTLGVVCLGS